MEFIGKRFVLEVHVREGLFWVYFGEGSYWTRFMLERRFILDEVQVKVYVGRDSS